MSALLCPLCRFINFDGVTTCMACGEPLARAAPARDDAAARRATLADQPFDDTRPADLAPDPWPAPPAPGVDLVDEAPAATVAPAGADASARKKAARRAHVRRLVMNGTSDVRPQTDGPPRVFVLQPDGAARDELRRLLESFGFQAVVGSNAAAAHLQWLDPRQTMLAAFVDVRLRMPNGGDGIDQCKLLRDARAAMPGPRATIVLTAVVLTPADRVRAVLAGCNRVIVGPVTRGLVAGALDHEGITLPIDSRRVPLDGRERGEDDDPQ